MIPWYWLLIAYAVGEITGVVVIWFCTMNEQKHDSKYIK